MKQAVRIVVLLAALVPIGTVAQTGDFSVTVSQDIFRPGDVVEAEANIYNHSEKPMDGVVTATLVADTDQVAPSFATQSVSLQPGESRRMIVHRSEITEESPAGDYRLIIALFVGGEERERSELVFSIVGTLQALDLALTISSADSEALESRVFLTGKSVRVGFRSSVDDVDVRAWIEGPGYSSDEEFVLPTVLRVEEVGSYKVTIAASAEGYRRESRAVWFSAIEEQPRIPLGDVVESQ